MTYAPSTLTALGKYWTLHGGVNLGIVGDANHVVGYHCGRDRIYSAAGQGDADYSVKHPRDKAGLSGAASAIDLGKLNGTYTQLREFSRWLVEHSKVNGQIREIIYSPDGVKVQRWSGIDGKIHTGPGNGDDSHRFHTHISYFRDTEQDAKIQTFAPYFEGENMRFRFLGSSNGTVTIGSGRGLVNLDTGDIDIPAVQEFRAFARVALAEPLGEQVDEERQKGYGVNYLKQAYLALDDVVEKYVPTVAPDTDGPAAPLTLSGDGVLYRREEPPSP